MPDKAVVSMPTAILTERLRLSEPRLAEVQELFSFLGDRGAMQHTHFDATFEACRRRIAVHEWRRRRDGFAPWTVRNRETGEIIGWGGLYDDPFDRGWGIELAYFFARKSWGNGFASELCRAALDFADNSIEAPRVSAFVHPKNAASTAILFRLGFKHQRHVPEMDRNHYIRFRGNLE